MTQPNTVYEALVLAAKDWPEKPFLNILPETAAIYGISAGEVTYTDLLKAVEKQIAAFRNSGIGYGMRFGVLVENRPVFFQLWFALNALGASIVPVNPDLRNAELEYLIGHSEISAAIVIPSRVAALKEAARAANCDIPIVGPDDALPLLADAPRPAIRPDGNTECALLYTSGTTGKPKGCILSNTYYLNNGRWYGEAGGLIKIRPGMERMLTPLPLFHMNAMATSTMAMMLSGGCLTILDRFHPRSWWDNVRDARATIVHYLGVMPPMLMSATEKNDDAKNEVIFGFGAGVDKQLHGAFEKRFGFPLVEAWAMTETGGGVIIAANHEPRHLGVSCIGKADSTTELRIVRDDGTDCDIDEPGELLVRRAGDDPRHGFFSAYLKDAAATEEAWAGNYFHTGDVVRRDADNYIYFVDRRKNVIRRSGENIAAVEVESVLLQHPSIAGAAVSAIADPVRGDEVFACIIPRMALHENSARQKLAEDIVNHTLQRLAYYKAPGWIAFVDALPLTATQKIQRGAMKDLVASLAERPDTIDTRAMKKRTVG